MRIQPMYIRDVIFPMHCLYPRYKNGVGYYPCGKCRFCRSKVAGDWAFRVEAECEDSYVYKALITYSDLYLPMYKGKPSLNKQDFVQMMKRFRYHIYKEFGARLRFFCVGEYGGNTHRPHYHVVLFSDKDLHRLSGRRNTLELVTEILVQTWRKGACGISKFEPRHNEDGIGQMVRYMTQYLLMDDGREYDKYNKPFRHMSRNSAIGYNWLETHALTIEQMQKKNDYSVFVGRDSNNKAIYRPLPRYYVNKIMPETERENRALEWYEYSNNYKNYIKKRNPYENYIDSRKRQEIRKDEEKFECEQYRKRKVHRFNQYAGELLKGLG